MFCGIANVAFETARQGDNLPYGRSVDAMLSGGGLDSLLRVTIAAGEVGLKRVGDRVDIRHRKPNLVSDLPSAPNARQLRNLSASWQTSAPMWMTLWSRPGRKSPLKLLVSGTKQTFGSLADKSVA